MDCSLPQCLTIESSSLWTPLRPSSIRFLSVFFRFLPWSLSGNDDCSLHLNFSNFSVNKKHPESLLYQKFLALPHRPWSVGLGWVPRICVSNKLPGGAAAAAGLDFTLNGATLPAFEFSSQIPSHSVLWAVSFPFSQALSSPNPFLREEALTPLAL